MPRPPQTLSRSTPSWRAAVRIGVPAGKRPLFPEGVKTTRGSVLMGIALPGLLRWLHDTPGAPGREDSARQIPRRERHGGGARFRVAPFEGGLGGLAPGGAEGEEGPSERCSAPLHALARVLHRFCRHPPAAEASHRWSHHAAVEGGEQAEHRSCEGAAMADSRQHGPETGCRLPNLCRNRIQKSETSRVSARTKDRWDTMMENSNEKNTGLSRRKALGRISALALGAYAAPAFTTMSAARASGASGGGGGGGGNGGSG